MPYGISVPENRQFCQILVVDIPKYISLCSFNCKNVLQKNVPPRQNYKEKKDFGSCQQVVIINLSVIKNHVIEAQYVLLCIARLVGHA